MFLFGLSLIAFCVIWLWLCDSRPHRLVLCQRTPPCLGIIQAWELTGGFTCFSSYPGIPQPRTDLGLCLCIVVNTGTEPHGPHTIFCLVSSVDIGFNKWMTTRNGPVVIWLLFKKQDYWVTQWKSYTFVSLQDFAWSLAHHGCSSGIDGTEWTPRDTCKGAASDWWRFTSTWGNDKLLWSRLEGCPVIKPPQAWCHTQTPVVRKEGLCCKSRLSASVLLSVLEPERVKIGCLHTDMVKGYSADCNNSSSLVDLLHQFQRHALGGFHCGW